MSRSGGDAACGGIESLLDRRRVVIVVLVVAVLRTFSLKLSPSRLARMESSCCPTSPVSELPSSTLMLAGRSSDSPFGTGAEMCTAPSSKELHTPPVTTSRRWE
jgi:hypothetical protein